MLPAPPRPTHSTSGPPPVEPASPSPIPRNQLAQPVNAVQQVSPGRRGVLSRPPATLHTRSRQLPRELGCVYFLIWFYFPTQPPPVCCCPPGLPALGRETSFFPTIYEFLPPQFLQL